MRVQLDLYEAAAPVLTSVTVRVQVQLRFQVRVSDLHEAAASS